MDEEERTYNEWLAKQDKSRDTYNILERLGQVARDYAKAERELARLRAENAELRARIFSATCPTCGSNKPFLYCSHCGRPFAAKASEYPPPTYAELRAENAELRARLDKLETQDICNKIGIDLGYLEELAARLDAQAQHPGVMAAGEHGVGGCDE